MGIYVHTGDRGLDAMLTDFAALWKKYSGNVCICSDKTLAEAEAAEADGYIVLIRESAWAYSGEGSAFLAAHTRCLCLTCPVSYAELEESLLRLAGEYTGEMGDGTHLSERHGEYEVTFDPAESSITANGNKVILTPTEYKLFRMLYAHKGEIVPRQALVRSVWKGEIAGNRCDVHIAGLRRKLIPIFGKGALTCVRGAGYVFRG
ncbi:MAG: winged helix-turn-helix transcriptional regulator [Clostridia bacterium]|nr:winged helix-turn-helix transcriptional regulator [Clostridia bacterium]